MPAELLKELEEERRLELLSRPKSVSEELTTYIEKFEELQNRFKIGSKMMLTTEDSALFNQHILEVVALLREALGDKNTYVTAIYVDKNNDRAEYPPSMDCVQKITATIRAAQTDIKRKEYLHFNKSFPRLKPDAPAQPEVIKKEIVDITFWDIFKLPLGKLTAIITVLVAIIGGAYYLGYNVKTWQTDKSLYELNKENQQLKEKVEKLEKQIPKAPVPAPATVPVPPKAGASK